MELEFEELTEIIIAVAIVRSYLKAAGQRYGLILNFSKPTLEIKRALFTE